MRYKENYWDKKHIELFLSQWKNELHNQRALCKEQPRCICLLQGDNPASLTYVRNKQRLAKEFDITIDVLQIPDSETFNVEGFRILTNKDSPYSSYFIQEPNNLEWEYVNFQYMGDADGDEEVGTKACTAYGIFKHMQWAMEKENDSLAGKSICILNRSNLIGKPLAELCIANRMVTTVSSSQAIVQPHVLVDYDFVIEATGKRAIQQHYYGSNTAVYDVTILPKEGGGIRGSIDEEMKEGMYITPVPYGVGQITLHALMHNIIQTRLYADLHWA